MLEYRLHDGGKLHHGGLRDGPDPQILADVPMVDGEGIGNRRSQLSNGRLFVATTAGHVYKLAP